MKFFVGVVLVLVATPVATAATFAIGPVEAVLEREEPGACLVNLPIPCLAWYDPGATAEPGDDTLHLSENIHHATARAYVAGLGGTGASLDFRNESVPIGVFQTYTALDQTVDGDSPDDVENLADLDINETGLHPRYPDIDHNLTVQPETRDWPWDSNFINYTSLHVPYTTYPRTSDYFIEGLQMPCWLTAMVGSAGCTGRQFSGQVIATLEKTLPNVVFGTEVRRAEARLADDPSTTQLASMPARPALDTSASPQSTSPLQVDTPEGILPRSEARPLPPAAGAPSARDFHNFDHHAYAPQGNSASPSILPLLAAALLATPPLAYALYHRITGKKALDHPHRRRIQAMLLEHPGMNVMEMTRTLGLSYHTTRHHLDVLQRSGLVRLHVERRRVLAYIEGHERDATVAATLGCETRRDILRLVGGAPGMRQAHLARKLGLARSTVHAHVRALARAGLLDLAGGKLRLPDAPLQRPHPWNLQRLTPAGPAQPSADDGGPTPGTQAPAISDAG